MKEFTVMFRSAEEIGSFVSLANRQSFPVQLLTTHGILDAGSILNLCYIGLNKPLTVRLLDDERSEDFRTSIARYLVS